MSQEQSKMCNRCKTLDDKGGVITPMFKDEGYVCRECFYEYRKLYNEIASDFINGLPSPKTLRDEFAMAALGETVRWSYEKLEGSAGTHKEYAANLAYEIADAMLEVRKAKGE